MITLASQGGHLICCAGAICTPIILWNSFFPSRKRIEFQVHDDALFTLNLFVGNTLFDGDTIRKFPIRPEAWFFSVHPGVICSVQFYQYPESNKGSGLSEEQQTKFSEDERKLLSEGRKIDAWVIVSGLQYHGCFTKDRDAPTVNSNMENVTDRDIDMLLKADAIVRDRLHRAPRTANVVVLPPYDNEDSHRWGLWQGMSQPHHCCGSLSKELQEKVARISNLHIADASVISRSIDGYLHAPLMGLGWRVGQHVAENF